MATAMVSTYAMGRLALSVDGSHPVVAHVRDEFAALRVNDARSAHLRISFVDALPRIPGSVHVGPLAMGNDVVSVSHRGVRYCVARRGDGIDVSIVVDPLSRRRRYAPRALARLANWTNLAPHERIARDVVYEVFDYLSQIAQLPLDQSYMHASGFERDGYGVAILAAASVGKTAVMLRFILGEGWRYLSDDLVVIDRSGTLWRSPKRLQVYAHNTAEEPRFERRLMSGRSWSDRVAWHWWRQARGPSKVRRRISAERMFGADLVGTRAPLRHAIMLERTDCREFSVAPMPAHDLAVRATAAVLSEMKPFVSLSLAVQASSCPSALPSVQSMHDATLDVLAEALSRAECVHVSVPLHAKPDDVMGCLRSVLPGWGIAS